MEMVVFITRSIYIIWGKVHLIHIMQPFQMILRTVVSFSDRSVMFNIGTFINVIILGNDMRNKYL